MHIGHRWSLELDAAVCVATSLPVRLTPSPRRRFEWRPIWPSRPRAGRRRPPRARPDPPDASPLPRDRPSIKSRTLFFFNSSLVTFIGFYLFSALSGHGGLTVPPSRTAAPNPPSAFFVGGVFGCDRVSIGIFLSAEEQEVRAEEASIQGGTVRVVTRCCEPGLRDPRDAALCLGRRCCGGGGAVAQSVPCDGESATAFSGGRK